MERLRAAGAELKGKQVTLGPVFTVGLVAIGYGLARRRRNAVLVGLTIALGEAYRGVSRARHAPATVRGVDDHAS
jgi:hypothetical protein